MTLRRPGPVNALYGVLTGFFVLWCAAKMYMLYHWRYTAELYAYDQSMGETLGGHLGLESTHGNQLGSHFLLWLVALAPLRAVLGSASIYLLVCIPPLCFLAYCLFVRWLLGTHTALHPHLCLLLGVLPLFLLPAAGLENVHGFHFDSAACYLGLALALAWQYRSVLELRNRGWLLWGWWFLFVTSQEVFALLAVLLFASITWVERTSRAWTLALASAVYFVLAVAAIRASTTPFNQPEGAWRGVWALVQTHPAALWTLPPAAYKLAVLGSSAAFVAVAALSTGLCGPGLGLLIMGLGKLSAAFAVREFSLVSWHNFPGLVFCFGGIGLQAMQCPALQAPLSRLRRWGVTAGTLAAGLGCMWLVGSGDAPNAVQGDLAALSEELEMLATQVPARHITSVDKNLLFPWRPFSRVVHYPHGVIDPPQAIADYVVTWQDAPPFPPVPACYAQIGSSPHFNLYRRSGPCGALDAQRHQYMDLFGRDALGYDDTP